MDPHEAGAETDHKGAAEKKQTDHCPHSSFLCTAWWKKVEKNGGCEENVFHLYTVSHFYSLSNRQWIILNTESVVPMMVIGEQFPCQYLNP